MKVRHIIISRAWFEDKALMEKYLAVASKVLIPALKAQTCQDYEFGIILKNEDIGRFREVLGIEFTPFSGMDDFKGKVLSGKYNIQTRQDIDDWISETYVETIQRLFKETSFKTMVIHAHPVKMTYPAGEESEMREYSGKHTSMFLSLCQHEVNHTVFDKQHGMMYTLADKVVKLEKGYAKWVQHSDSVSNTRDKVRGVKMLSGPDNVLHTWVNKPPKMSDEVKVRYNNGKIKTHRRRYALDLVKMGIARIIEEETAKKLVVKMPVLNQGRVIDYDKEYKIGVVIVCYETPELIKRAVNSVMGVEGLRVMIVDNSSKGSECYKVCDNLAADDNVDVIHTGRNIFHGPGLHLGIENLSTEYICVMDSDAKVLNKDVFGKMVSVLQDRDVYAVGGYVERVPKGNKLYSGFAFDYLKPWFSMFRTESYYKFSPFVHHGSPWCQAMIDIKGKKKVLQINDIKKYVKHDHCGTYKVAGNAWSKGWHGPIIARQINVTMICFVYNEINYLPHVVNFWKNQDVNIYVIDNMSNDGTWEWLQENKIPSHRFDTKEMFHLDWLQEELTKTLHKIKPDWVIYGAADLYYGFGEPVKNVIQRAESQGYNQIRMPCWFGVNTGEKRKLPLIENYFYCKPFTNIVMISKYHKDIRFAGDHIYLPEKKIVQANGIILNYGSCKSPQEQEIKLKRRQKAWDVGMTKTYGSHYRSGKTINWVYKREEMKDVRKSEYFGYYKNILSLCEVRSGSSQAYVSESVKKFKDNLFSKFNLVDYRDINSPVVIFGMYRPEDYELFEKHKGRITVVWRGTDSTMINDERLQVIHSKPARHIAISKFISSDLKRYSISNQIIPITGTKPELGPCPRGEYIYHYGKTAIYGVKYLDEIERKTGIKIIRTHGQYSQKEIYDIYKKCFIGLRLTSHDGLPNTVLEMGLMGRRCIYNGGTPHSIPWKGIDDICESIKNEYKRKDEDNAQISEDVKRYIDIGTNWLISV